MNTVLNAQILCLSMVISQIFGQIRDTYLKKSDDSLYAHFAMSVIIIVMALSIYLSVGLSEDTHCHTNYFNSVKPGPK